MAREHAQRIEDEHAGYDQPRADARLLDAGEGLQGKVTDWEKAKGAESEEKDRAQEAANDAEYQREFERISVQTAQHAARKQIAQKQAILKERQAVRLAGNARAITGLARWAGLSVAVTAWFWQFLCAAVSLVGIGAWATVSELVNGNIVGRAVNWGLGLFGTSIENLIPMDTFAMAFWALAAIIAAMTFIGFLIWFFMTGAHVFSTPLIAIMTTLTFALSLLPVSNLFPWIPLWVVVVNLHSTAHAAQKFVGK